MGHRWTDPGTGCEFNTRVCASVANLIDCPSLHHQRPVIAEEEGMRRLSHGRAARGMVRFLRKHFGKPGLFTQPESSNDLLIPGPVFARQVLQELVAAADQFQQAAPRRMVLLMLIEVVTELIDARRDYRDLAFRGARIFIVSLVI